MVLEPSGDFAGKDKILAKAGPLSRRKELAISSLGEK